MIPAGDGRVCAPTSKLIFFRVVAEARNLARKLGSAFIETSAKERINVDEAFIALVREIKRAQQVLYPRPPLGLGRTGHSQVFS